MHMIFPLYGAGGACNKSFSEDCCGQRSECIMKPWLVSCTVDPRRSLCIKHFVSVAAGSSPVVGKHEDWPIVCFEVCGAVATSTSKLAYRSIKRREFPCDSYRTVDNLPRVTHTHQRVKSGECDTQVVKQSSPSPPAPGCPPHPCVDAAADGVGFGGGCPMFIFPLLSNHLYIRSTVFSSNEPNPHPKF